jgi:hypothetical protein
LTDDEENLSDGPFGGWKVVLLSSKVETEEQEEDRQIDEILAVVRENNTLLKEIRVKL